MVAVVVTAVMAVLEVVLGFGGVAGDSHLDTASGRRLAPHNTYFLAKTLVEGFRGVRHF